MTVPINFRPEAVEEIDATFQWYEEQRGGLGEEFLSALLRWELNGDSSRRSLYARNCGLSQCGNWPMFYASMWMRSSFSAFRSTARRPRSLIRARARFGSS